MEDEVRNILETFKSVEKDLHELINTDDFSYYVAQIAGRDSFLNSFPSLLKELENTNQDVKLAVAEITKRLSYFMLIFNKRSLSFFYAIPSNETEEDFLINQ